MRMPLLAGLAAPAFALALLAAPPAWAEQSTYHFQGECFDCNGGDGGLGQADLVLQDYTEGEVFTNQNFVSFRYYSDILTFDSTESGWELSGAIGFIPGLFGGPGDFDLDLFRADTGNVSGNAQGAVGVTETFNFSVNYAGIKGLPGGTLWCASLSSDPGSVSDCRLQNDDYGGEYSISLVPTETPEPATLALLGAGLAGLGLARRRRG